MTDADLAAIRCCTVLPLADDRLEEAAAEAIRENPANGPSAMALIAYAPRRPLSPASMALLADRRWAPGRVLRVRLLGGTKSQRSTLMRYADEWSQHANVVFQQVSRGPAEIRASFDPRLGSWSYMGTDALLIRQDAPTLNIGWTPDSAVCLHELGHALGCVHEHQHPESAIPWNKRAVYAYYQGSLGWSRQMVDQNLFGVYSRGITNFSSYDRHSIMHYPVDPRLLADPSKAVGWNAQLSPIDKSYIGLVYPRTSGAGAAFA